MVKAEEVGREVKLGTGEVASFLLSVSNSLKFWYETPPTLAWELHFTNTHVESIATSLGYLQEIHYMEVSPWLLKELKWRWCVIHDVHFQTWVAKVSFDTLDSSQSK